MLVEWRCNGGNATLRTNDGATIPVPAARSSRMPWAGPVTPTAPAPLTSRRSGVPVSATLAANEALGRRRRGGQPVLPLAFGEAGLPVHPLLREALAAAAASNGYGPVAGVARAARGRGRLLDPARPAHRARRRWSAARAASRCCTACCWPSARDVAVPRPELGQLRRAGRAWSARARTSCPPPPGEGGVLRPRARWRPRSTAAAAGGRRDPLGDRHPAGQPHRHGWPARRRSARCARWPREHDLIIISDEIYRDLVHDPGAGVPQPGRGRARAHRGDHRR